MAAQDEISLFVERLDAVGAEYMITGATAAILYGQPRVTNDLDVVLDLHDDQVSGLIRAFPSGEFCLPPESVIRVEQSRALRGHFNIIHHDTGYRADVYLAGTDPLHAWALPLRSRIEWTDSLSLYVAPPEYVVLRKLEFFREGGATEHTADIATILKTTDIDLAAVEHWSHRLGLDDLWFRLRHSGR